MRSISQIYSEAVSTRNNYLQLTELNSGRSNSKLSIINLLTYVVAVCIYTYETILDAFEVRVAKILSGRINGTPDWYAQMALKFQYNSATGTGDKIIFNEDTLKVEYETVNTSHRIVAKSAWQLNSDKTSITLKVCKTNTNDNEISEGVPYIPLSSSELTSFKSYIQNIRFVGAEITCASSVGDILTIVADSDSPIYYDDNYVTAAQALAAIKESLVDFVTNFDFNGWLYYQQVIDVIRKTENISDVSSGIKVYITYDKKLGDFSLETKDTLTDRIRLNSGYIRLLDKNSVTTINDTNLTLVAASTLNS